MKKITIAKILFFFFSLAIVFNACKSEEALTLNFSPEVSKKYEITMLSKQDMSMGAMGDMQNTIVMNYDLLIKEKDNDGNFIILTTFKKMGFDTKSPQGNISYDSDSKTESDDMASAMIGKIFGGMIGQSFSMTVNKNGEVTQLKGMEAIFQNIIKNMGLDTVPGGMQAVAGFRNQFSDEQFKKNFGESFNILPSKEVKVGDTWAIDNSNNMMGFEMKTKNTYTLKDIKGNLAIVELVSDFNLGSENDENDVKMKMDGSQSGSLKIDINTGMTIESNIKQNISATQKMMGQEMPMKIDGTVKMTSKEIN
jgi:hypothetical protein